MSKPHIAVVLICGVLVCLHVVHADCAKIEVYPRVPGCTQPGLLYSSCRPFVCAQPRLLNKARQIESARA